MQTTVLINFLPDVAADHRKETNYAIYIKPLALYPAHCRHWNRVVLHAGKAKERKEQRTKKYCDYTAAEQPGLRNLEHISLFRRNHFMQTETQNKKGFRYSVVAIVALSLVLALALTACSSGGTSNATSNAGNTNSGAADKTADTDKTEVTARIPISEISETAQFYPVTVDGTRMEVVAVKAPDGTIRTAFNTCQVCNGSPKAYFKQSGTTLQCQNCGNKFPMSKVGVEAGGCNPVPIFDTEKTVTDESITIPYETLQANTYRFPSNWKQ
jgi:uncharacterized membrane protein